MVDQFDKLPNEMLLAIFMIGLRDALSSYGTDFRPSSVLYPWLVSTVCRRWRNIACSSTEMWTCIHLSDDRLRFLPFFLERSGQQPIHLILRFLNSEPAEVVGEFSLLLSSEIYRVRSFELDLRLPCYSLPKFFTMLSAHPASNLTSLNVRCSPDYHAWDCVEAGDHPVIVKGTNSLQSLVLKGICLRASPPLVGLTHLEIHAFRPSITQFRDLFQSNPTLSSLCLPRFLKTDSWDGEQSPVTASSLRSLSVGLKTHWGTGRCECALASLKMDNLEYLEIIDLSGDICSHFSRENGLQNVRKLRLCHYQSDSDVLDTGLWTALSAVTHIELDNTVGFYNVIRATPGREDSTVYYFPKLTCLSFLDADGDCAQLLSSDEWAQVIGSRGATSLKKLELPLEVQDITHPFAAAMREAAMTELVFINSDSDVLRLAHYSSNTEPDDDDYWREGNYSDFEEEFEEWYPEDSDDFEDEEEEDIYEPW
ncbi:hypothetical protein D9757_005336 [Collybiopsis confluens]|uniref:F-box domain-containing protein n=1 Tax=Collybiopsis confluens TaxID=2823264 RepID=A0A8H5M9B5_9AGAR|nr:hypothetical protein D9757_005336 [Collybiopsis confluens]